MIITAFFSARRMFLKASFFFVCLLLPSTGAAQATMREVFTQMPDSLMPYLSSTNRLDFIDFLDSNMKAEVTNLFDGKSEMTVLTDDSLSVKLNSLTRVDMFLLEAQTSDNDSLRQVVCMVTVLKLSGEQEETSVSFFETSWTPIDPTQLIIRDERRQAVIKSLKEQKTLKFYDRLLN